MFYQTGVDITNDKQMFNFLRNHYEYYVLGSWNRVKSIANNMKLYKLDLSGDWCAALSILEKTDYEVIDDMIISWEAEHPKYQVRSNGRSNGYLVLSNKHNSQHILPDEIYLNDNYEEYKEYCRYHFGSVKANRSDLVFYTKLVQDFDRLCDQIRAYCDFLSTQSFASVAMKETVERFNDTYYTDLRILGYSLLQCDDAGAVDITEISRLQCLAEAFFRIAEDKLHGYKCENIGDINRVVIQYT